MTDERRTAVGARHGVPPLSGQERLIHDLCLDALTRSAAQARAALADGTRCRSGVSPVHFIRHALDQGAGALLPAIAGRIPITDQLLAARADHDAALTELVTAAQQAGQLRHDIGSGDIWRYWCGDRSQCVRCRA